MKHWQSKVVVKVHINSLKKLMESQVGNQEHKPSGTIQSTRTGQLGLCQILELMTEELLQLGMESMTVHNKFQRTSGNILMEVNGSKPVHMMPASNAQAQVISGFITLERNNKPLPKNKIYQDRELAPKFKLVHSPRPS